MRIKKPILEDYQSNKTSMAPTKQTHFGYKNYSIALLSYCEMIEAELFLDNKMIIALQDMHHKCKHSKPE